MDACLGTVEVLRRLAVSLVLFDWIGDNEAARWNLLFWMIEEEFYGEFEFGSLLLADDFYTPR